MPRIIGALPYALAAAREGISGNQFYRDLKESGLGARRSEVLALYKIAANIVARSPDEPFRDITQAPLPDHLMPYPTRNASGIRQTVTLVYRDRVTGNMLTTYYSITSAEGRVREQVMAQAISAYAEHAERYEQDLVGAVHTGAHIYMPNMQP